MNIVAIGAICATLVIICAIGAYTTYAIQALKPKQVTNMDEIREQLEKLNIKISRNTLKSSL